MERVVFLYSKLKEMLEIYGVNKQGLVFISQMGKIYPAITGHKNLRRAQML